MRALFAPPYWVTISVYPVIVAGVQHWFVKPCIRMESSEEDAFSSPVRSNCCRIILTGSASRVGWSVECVASIVQCSCSGVSRRV